MRAFLNNHPFIALAMVGLVSGAAIKVAEIIKEKSIIDKVDVIVINKRNCKVSEEKNDAEKVESVEE